MALQKITTIAGRAVYVPGNDIDTDRIIPARFLKCVTFDDLGEGLFADDRTAVKSNGGTHPLDDTAFIGAEILLSGANFGCGSSREHAPQAIKKFGLRAVVAEGYAEIFLGNATNIGLPCLTAERLDIQKIATAVAIDPAMVITLDLMGLNIRFGNETVPVTMRESARDALVHGRWDPIGELLEGSSAVAATAASLPYLNSGN
ncbi:MAG: 3-isopropylmalate dehydratase small subunit [Cephaloticoccus sp.]|nr:3-isopropylmalate dehydratase small subunit [Cephaloticoccus sp.]MCF7760689.1 3-isopropylmalate dehydratase small subunit [Cephaloticoccus sp.]